METKKMESKVITKSVTFGNHKEQYVLVQFKDDNGEVRYGTIPYSNIDDKGHLIKGMNGLEMCLCSTIPSALEMREDLINCEGMTAEQVIEYFKKKIGSVA